MTTTFSDTTGSTANAGREISLDHIKAPESHDGNSDVEKMEDGSASRVFSPL